MAGLDGLRSLLPKSTVLFYRNPLTIVRGERQFLFDKNNRKYLDMFGGIVTVSVGHCHPKVNAALKGQVDQLWHTTSIYNTEPVLEYARALTSTLPEQLSGLESSFLRMGLRKRSGAESKSQSYVCFFCNSGSEANDLAITLARLHTARFGYRQTIYVNKTNTDENKARFDMLSMRNGYHGMTQTVMGATNLGNWKQPMPNGFGILKAMHPDTFSGPFTGGKCRDCPVYSLRHRCDCSPDQCNAGEKYLDELDRTLNYDFPASSGPAALMVESIQGVGGTVQFPKNYIKSAFSAIKSRGGVTISDEVQTGFGRLGSHFWGFQSHGVAPDIVTMAKGMGNGFPLAACVTTPEIAASISHGLYFNTFGGNPLASVVGKAVLESLHSLKSPLIGDVRGKGLMIGVELVKADGSPISSQTMSTIFELIKDQGVLVGKGGLGGNVLRLKPPLCVTKENADESVGAIQNALQHCQQ